MLNRFVLVFDSSRGSIGSWTRSHSSQQHPTTKPSVRLHLMLGKAESAALGGFRRLAEVWGVSNFQYQSFVCGPFTGWRNQLVLLACNREPQLTRGRTIVARQYIKFAFDNLFTNILFAILFELFLRAFKAFVDSGRCHKNESTKEMDERKWGCLTSRVTVSV